MGRVKVIGIGSPFGADSLGWRIVRKAEDVARRAGPGLQSVEFVTADRPGAALLALMDDTQAVILVDAVAAHGPVGRLVRLQGPPPRSAPKGFSSHEFGVAETLALGYALDRLPPRLVLLGLTTDDPAVTFTEAQQQMLIDAVVREIDACTDQDHRARFHVPGVRAAHPPSK